jgi:hypothetical protein
MGERPTLEHEISRINNNKGYQPGNCEWTIDGVAQTRNRRKQKYHSNRGKATSRFRGVDLWAGKLWRARIALRGKVKYLGTFRKETEAARTYDKVARLHRGFILNFPEL